MNLSWLLPILLWLPPAFAFSYPHETPVAFRFEEPMKDEKACHDLIRRLAKQNHLTPVFAPEIAEDVGLKDQNGKWKGIAEFLSEQKLCVFHIYERAEE